MRYLNLVGAGLCLFGAYTAVVAAMPYVGQVPIGSSDPKTAWFVISPEYVVVIIFTTIALMVLSGVHIANHFPSLTALANASQRLQEVEAEKVALEQMKASLGQEIADLEAKRDEVQKQRLESVQLENMRRQIRSEVEQEWQRDRQFELESEHARYMGYVNRQRADKAAYEAAKLEREHRVLQLEKFVLGAYPDFAQRTDPTGVKSPDVVSAAFRKFVVKKLDDPELLQLSQDPDVRQKLGSLTDFPAAPAPISPPVLVPIPEKLRLRFEGEQVHNMIARPRG